jgi:alkylated DNA repair dioxygenase AlkB
VQARVHLTALLVAPLLLPVRDRAAGFAGLASDALPHVLATEYTPGAPIGWHRDKAVFGALQAIQP